MYYSIFTISNEDIYSIINMIGSITSTSTNINEEIEQEEKNYLTNN